MLLVPIPAALLLLGDWNLKIAAVVLYFIIGITDLFDGFLARRYGKTKLGSFLDPIADKIYIVFLLIPISLLGFLPHWLIIAILIRDPLIARLRSISNTRGIAMKTTQLAQYKTAFQMVAGGYILWVSLVREERPALIGMFCVVGLSLLWLLLYLYIRQRFHPRLITVLAGVTLVALIRSVFSPEITAFIYGFGILGVTWASAIHYLTLFTIEYPSGTEKVPILWWIIHFLECLALPLFILILQGDTRIPCWVPMALLSIEIASVALDNIITADRLFRSFSRVSLKLLIQFLVSLLIAVKLWFPKYVPSSLSYPLCVDAYLLVAITFIAFLLFFARHGLKMVTIETWSKESKR
jgi:CDP-diacylglycerol--glycerol-3-phosphate 3-phosphatidyltransferase